MDTEIVLEVKGPCWRTVLNLASKTGRIQLQGDATAAIGLRAAAERCQFGVQERDKQRALEYFAIRSNHYYRRVERGLLKPLRDRERAAVLRFAALSAPGTMLDVGCGQGFYAMEAKQRGMNVCAIDPIPGMLVALASEVDEVQLGDIETFRSDREYDRVICAGVLDFVIDPERAFLNLCRLVAPSGRLVLLVPRRGIGGLLYRFEKLTAGFRINFFDLGWFEQLAVRTRLRVVECSNPLPTNLAILLKRSPHG